MDVWKFVHDDFPTNCHNRVTLIKVVIMRNVGTRCNHDCTFIHEWVHHRSPDSVYVRVRTRRQRRSSRLHGNLELACAGFEVIYDTVREKTPFTETVSDGWWRTGEHARTKVQRASRFSVMEFSWKITIRKFIGDRTKLHLTWIRHLILLYLHKTRKIDL